MIDINIKGLLYVTRKFLLDMIAKNQGHIINVSSISKRSTYSVGAVYCMAKFTVGVTGKALRLD